VVDLGYGIKLAKSYILFKLGRPKLSYVVYCCTARCNLRCVFCDWWKRSIAELDSKSSMRLIDNLCDFGVSVIDFSGGEPTLRKDLESLALRARDYGVFTILSTNGTTVTEERAKSIARAFNMVNISIDGFEHTHDSTRGVEGVFRRAMRSIELLRSCGVKVGVDLTIYRANAKEVLKLFNWLKGRVDFVSFQPIMPYPPDPDMSPSLDEVDGIAEGLMKLKKEHPSYVAPTTWYIEALRDYFRCRLPRICDAGTLYCMVDPDGTVFACNAVRSSVMGNASLEDMRVMWNSERRLRAIKETEKCKGCLSQCTTAISMTYRRFPSKLDLKGLISLAFKS